MLTNVAQEWAFGDGGVGTPTNGMSLDQYVASIIGTESRFRSLELGVQTNARAVAAEAMYARMSYSAPSVPVAADDDPAHVYSRLFGPLLDVDERVQSRRKSMIDIAHRDLADLQTRLSAAERAKLDLHLQAIEDMERGWEGELLCVPPDAPEADQFTANANFPTVARSQIDMLVAAIACGMTNVATLQFSQTVSPVVMAWLGHDVSWHEHAHLASETSMEGYLEGQRWFMEQVGYLLDRLKSFPDPATAGGTLLDDTIVLVCHEMADPFNHQLVGMQHILAGSAAGQWTTGKQFSVEGNHAALLVSICRALGIDIDVFGRSDAGSGGLAVLS